MRNLILTIIAVFVAQVTFACSASFTYTTGASNNNLLLLSYSITSTVGTPPPNGYYTYNLMDFGDGTVISSNGSNSSSHNYAAPGTYNVKLITNVIDTFQSVYCSDTVIHSITVNYPTCAVSWTSVAGAGGSVTFTASNPGGASGLNYYWGFGDGTSATGNPVTHTYAANGNYNIYLMDSSSTCGYFNQGTITVTGLAACLGVQASFSSIVSNNNVSFNNTSSGYIPGSTNITDKWYFGDGTTSNQASPVHTYATPGSYTVSLRRTWFDSSATTNVVVCTDSTVRTVTVDSIFSCANSHALFTTSTSGLTTTFTNTSTYSGYSAAVSAAWNFGDGSYTTTSYSPVHTYAAAGTYTVSLAMVWTDTLTNTACIDSIFHTVTVSGSSNPCAGSHASFTTSTNGLTETFTNTSTYSGVSASVSSAWNFGDGSWSTSYSPVHTYAATGTYTVSLAMVWTDTLTNTACLDSVFHTVTIFDSLNQITGNIHVDTLSGNNPHYPELKVWLINYDSVTSILSAVDSVNVLGDYEGDADYVFNNEPAGQYRVKAMLTNGPTSGTAAVPTYGYNSLYWSSAHVINHSGFGINSNNNILMQDGTVTNGPGFIGGNVTSGANKGTHTTGIPVAGLVMFLEDVNGKPLAYTTTDANGKYTFSNFPAGSYTVYPEGLGYVTTPAAVTVGATQLNNVNFVQHTLSMTITPVNNAGVVNVTTNSAAFNIFPNPSNGVFNISWSSKTGLQNAHTVVNDVVGRKVFEADMNMGATSGNTQLNLSQLKAGVYFISVNAGDVNYTTKVVLQH